MAALQDLLNNTIDGMTSEDTTRSDIISRMATAAGIDESTVSQILREEISCPPLRRLEGFARVLDVSMSRIRSAAEADGCEYDEKGIGVLCYSAALDKVQRILRKAIA